MYFQALTHPAGSSLLRIGIFTALFCLAAIQSAHADGQTVYDEHCSSCHNGGFKGLMARAPKIGKDSAWEDYFSKGLEASQNEVLNGTGKHKAMGEEAGLSAEAVNDAIAYILSKTNVTGL